MKSAQPLLIIILFLSLVAAALAPPQSVLAQSGEPLTIFGVNLNCYPELPPSDPQGCGLPEFMNLLRGIIRFFLILLIPIASAVFVWGGIVIMTAGGSEERVGKGKKMMVTALVGVAVALGSWLIVHSIYLALTVKDEFIPK